MIARAGSLKARSTEDFLSDLAHDMRTPLAAIQQFSSILADGLAGPTTEAQREYLEIILRNVEQLRTKVDRLQGARHAERAPRS